MALRSWWGKSRPGPGGDPGGPAPKPSTVRESSRPDSESAASGLGPASLRVGLGDSAGDLDSLRALRAASVSHSKFPLANSLGPT